MSSEPSNLLQKRFFSDTMCTTSPTGMRRAASVTPTASVSSPAPARKDPNTRSPVSSVISKKWTLTSPRTSPHSTFRVPIESVL